MAGLEPQRCSRWRSYDGLAEIGKASGSRHVEPVDPVELEEQLQARRSRARERREERVGRWARALVEKAMTVARPRRSRSEGPSTRTRKEEAMLREELKKEEALSALGWWSPAGGSLGPCGEAQGCSAA